MTAGPPSDSHSSLLRRHSVPTRTPTRDANSALPPPRWLRLQLVIGTERRYSRECRIRDRAQ